MLPMYIEGNVAQVVFDKLELPAQTVFIKQSAQLDAEIQTYKVGKHILCVRRKKVSEAQDNYFCSVAVSVVGQMIPNS